MESKKKINNINIILICGIPGVGKSSFTKLLKTILTKEYCWEATSISFDNIFINNSKIDLTKYNDSRLQFYNSFKNKLKENIDNSESPFFMLLDDNFYFRSMRKPFYKLVKEQLKSNISITYLEIHLLGSLDYCLKNNKNRKTDIEVIPDQVVEKMYNCFENFSFLKNLVHNIQVTEYIDKISSDDIDTFLNRLSSSHDDILLALKKEEGQKSENKKESKSLFMEHLDKEIRVKNSEIIKSNKSLGKELANHKQQFLQLIKSLLYSKSVTKVPINMDIELLLSIQETCNSIKESNYNKTKLTDTITLYEKFINLH
jgi:tRNA uridine 5-carbamoylmethylation protein Kti12